MVGPLWRQMHEQPRRSMAELNAADIPDPPGVYALYRDGVRMYVGKADHLRHRIWKTTPDEAP